MEINRWIARWENEGGALPAPKSSSPGGARKESQTVKREATGLRRILVPIDFSPQSLKTLRYAKLLADRFGAKLHLVHVVNPSVFSARHLMLPWAAAETELARNAKKRLKNLATEHSLPPRPTVRTGAAADEISHVARATDADLIAIATRGYTGLKHAFLGSTTERVVREAPCPVLVVRDKESQSDRGGARKGRSAPQFRKILVPVDFSESSRLGLDYALRFAQPFRAHLVLFHSVFVQPYVLGGDYTARAVPNLLSMQQDYADDEMEKLRRWACQKGDEVETKVVAGSPVEQIGHYVSKENVDLIITSTHGQSGLRRVFTGSTAEHLVRHAPCPVLVIPNRSLRKRISKSRGRY